MSDENTLRSVVKEISSEFAGLLKASNVASEERHARTDSKLDKLIETLTENTLELREARKEREYTNERMERIETNQKQQGEKVQSIAEQVLLINERQNTSKGKWDRISDGFHKVLVWVVIAGLAAWWGVK